jgi:hypothetical protein
MRVHNAIRLISEFLEIALLDQRPALSLERAREQGYKKSNS